MQRISEGADPTPTDSEARKQFVARVASLQNDVLKPKLLYMIKNAHEMMEITDNDRDVDLVLKGSIYMARELIRWGDQCQNELIANARESQDETEQSI